MRKAVRELFLTWFICAIAVAVISAPETIDGGSIFATLFVSFLACLPIWLFYKIVRFAIDR